MHSHVEQTIENDLFLLCDYDWCSNQAFLCFFAAFRHHGDSDECSRTSCVPHQTSQAGASPATCQQEWHQACAWSGPLLQEDHKETGPQRCFLFCHAGLIFTVPDAPLTNSIFFLYLAGKTPEEVVKRYLQKVRNPPDEVGLPLATADDSSHKQNQLTVDYIFSEVNKHD